jgi:predicted aminopeptidase
MTQQASQLSEDDARTASAQAQVRIAELEAGIIAERARTEAAYAAHRMAEARVSELRAALQTIRDNYGKVCRGFELCTHAACQSSYGAWAVADAALSARGGEGAT